MCFIEQFSGSWFLSNEIFQSPGFFQWLIYNKCISVCLFNFKKL
jgi:hypothetical protein